jgi:PBSX family phage terminase large subunit
MFATSNPASPAHWLKRDWLNRAALHLTGGGDVLRSEASDRIGLHRFSFRLADNPSLPASYVEQIKRDYTGLFYRRYVLGEWVAAEGAVFDMWDPDRHVVDILPPIVRWVCMAVDYGTSNPLHALLIGVGVDGRLYVVAEWRYDSRRQHRQLTDAEYSQRLRTWLGSVPIPAAGRRSDGTVLSGVQPEFVVVDPSAASFRVQLHNDHLTNVAADNEVVDGIRLVSTLLSADRLRVSRACPELIAELPGYSWDDKAQERGEDKPIKVDDHGVDALRYGVKTTRSVWGNYVDLAAA